MALTLSNSAAVKAVGDYMRKGSAYERPLDATVIDRLIAAGVTLGPGTPGGDTGASTGTSGATKNALGNNQVAGLLKLIQKYSGGGSFNLSPLNSAVNLLIQSTAYQVPLSEEVAKLILQFANSVSFPQESKGLLDSLRDAPASTLIYLLYWVGTVSPANPYLS